MLQSLLEEVDQMFKEKPFLTLEDITTLLGCSKTVIYNWAKRSDPGRRPPRLIVGKTLRLPKKEFVKWLAKEQGGAGCDQ